MRLDPTPRQVARPSHMRLALPLLLVGATANASPTDQADALRWTGGLTMTGGATTLASRTGAAFGPQLAFGARSDGLALLASYAVLGLGDGSCHGTRSACRALAPVAAGNGLEHRLAVDARLSVLEGDLPPWLTTKGPPSALWIEAGVGRERADWGAVSAWRDDVSLGLGLDVGGRGGRAHTGLSYDLRALLARRPDDGRVIETSVMLGIGFVID
jgi:hypothetical protein